MAFQSKIMSGDWKYRYKNAKKNEHLKEFEDWSREDLIGHIMELRSAVVGLEKDLEAGTGHNGSEKAETPLTEADYKLKWSFPTKIAFLLTINQKPLTSEELHNQLLKLDSHYRDYKVPRNNLTVSIARSIKSGRIKKVKVPGIRSLYYVLPEWLDKAGELRKEFHSIFYRFE